MSLKFLRDNKDLSVSIRPSCTELTKFYLCKRCGKIHSKIHTCNTVYCKKCYDHKRKRNYARLHDYEIKARRLIHIVIGFKKSKTLPNKTKKKSMEKSLSKFHRSIRKKLDLKFVGLRIFDLSDKGRYDHFHYCLIPEKKFMNGRSLSLDLKLLRQILKKASKGTSRVIKIIGFRSKNNIFSYFSKRMAGRYGHGKTIFFLEDIMSFDSYKGQFHNVRKLVIIGRPGGLSCITALSQPKKHLCPYCNSPEIFLVDQIPTVEDYKPDPETLELIEIIKKGKLIEFCDYE